jgi:hypothetical protein
LARIENDEININLKYEIAAGKLMQVNEVLRRVKTKEMGKFKFLTNFGVRIEVLDNLKHKILF